MSPNTHFTDTRALLISLFQDIEEGLDLLPWMVFENGL